LNLAKLLTTTVELGLDVGPLVRTWERLESEDSAVMHVAALVSDEFCFDWLPMSDASTHTWADLKAFIYGPARQERLTEVYLAADEMKLSKADRCMLELASDLIGV
jgi:hypothetical protein